jgi:hypothetical protein
MLPEVAACSRQYGNSFVMFPTDRTTCAMSATGMRLVPLCGAPVARGSACDGCLSVVASRLSFCTGVLAMRSLYAVLCTTLCTSCLSILRWSHSACVPSSFTSVYAPKLGRHGGAAVASDYPMCRSGYSSHGPGVQAVASCPLPADWRLTKRHAACPSSQKNQLAHATAGQCPAASTGPGQQRLSSRRARTQVLC